MVLFMEVGTTLKEARIAQGLSLDSIQETTKIQKRYLVAIEQGNFHVLPGKFYARAFIKEYATAVGLNPDELLDEYQEEVPQAEDDNTEQYTRIQRSRRDGNLTKRSVNFSLFPTIIVILLIIGIFAAAFYFYSKTSSTDSADPVDTSDDNEVIFSGEKDTKDNKDAGKEKETKSDDAAKEEEQTDTKTEEQATDKPTLEVVEEGSGASPESTFELNNASDEVIISLESDGESYLDVINDEGKQYYAGMFSEAESPKEIDVTGDERIDFNVGYAPDLQITINGVELKYPFDPAEKMHQRIRINVNPAEE